MNRKRLIFILASLVWFGAAVAIYVDYLVQAAEIEPYLEEMRRHNQEHPEDAYWMCWWPRINGVWMLPLAMAGLFTIVGYWKIGTAIGVSVIAFIAYQVFG